MKITALGKQILTALAQVEMGEFILANEIPELLGDFHMKTAGLGRSASVLARHGLVETSGESPNRYQITDKGRDLVEKGFPTEED